MSKGVQIAIGALLVAGLVGWLGASQSSESAFTYFQTLGEFQASGTVGEPARVHGFVALGTIERDVAARRVTFAVQEAAPHAGGTPQGALRVEYASLETPDLFKDGAEVVVEGKLTAAGTFHATNLLAKCPSKFEAKAKEQAAAAAAGKRV
ncbi:MAG TPA: cytochrome c maturation protein CcmE [Myxococcota bacterium]|jgi:cytochrome c-type biogenesis protein CcmE